MSKNRLNPGDEMYPGEQLLSKNELVSFRLQRDGNLVLHNGTILTWSSGTYNKNVSHCIMQTDGNFVIYNTDGNAVWSSGTDGKDDSYLVVQDDGNAVIYYPNVVATWATNTDN